MVKIDTDDVAEFCGEFIRDHGYGPSVRDVALTFEVSTSTAHRHLMHLVKEGKMRVEAGRARTWQLVI